MVSKNIIKQPKAQVEVQIIVPWEDLSPKWDPAVQKLAQDVEVPGFRKGQAPIAMVESQLGTKLQDEVFKTLMPQFLVEALQGTDIIPIDYPKYQVVAFEKSKQLAFKANLTTRPNVQVGDYKAIKVQRPPQKSVTEETVEKVIGDLFKRWKTRNPASPATEPNDQFAQGVGAQNLLDLKTKLKTDLDNEAKYNNELDYEELILQEVAKITTVEMPDILVEDELSRMLVTLQRRVTEMGLLMEDYLKSQNETVEGLKNKWREQAEKNVRMELGLSEIARRENIQITDEQLQQEIDKIQDARLKAQFEQEEPRLHFRHSLRQIKTLDFLKGIVQTQ